MRVLGHGRVKLGRWARGPKAALRKADSGRYPGLGVIYRVDAGPFSVLAGPKVPVGPRGVFEKSSPAAPPRARASQAPPREARASGVSSSLREEDRRRQRRQRRRRGRGRRQRGRGVRTDHR
jgi:hypothetical protein